MDEELRKRNRRMLIALLIFALLLTLLVLAWKLSIYHQA
jgi:predicted nucleic acid-binding Zn ribbon protein